VDAKTYFSGSKSLHIGLVTETYQPEVNGVAMTLGQLVNGLGSLGHRIDVYRPAQSKLDKPVQQDNIRHITLPGMPIPGYREMHFGFPAGRIFRQQWQRWQPDALYVATEGPLGASAINTALKSDIPVISGFHTNFHSYSNHYRLGLLAPAILAYLRRMHNKTNMTLVPTKALAQQLQNRGFNNVEVLQRGVDINLFTPLRRSDALRQSWGADNDTIVCIYVGRIAAEKNIQAAVETVQALSSHYNIRFVLVGDGPLRKKIQREHPEFVFCGTRRNEDLAQHYASADVLLFPSRTETFGNVVTESMASGLATVAYDEAAAHEHIKDFYNGVLASDTPRHDFTAVTMRLCKQHERIRTIGLNASEYTKKLGWPTIVDRFSSLLHEVCSKSGSFNRDEEYNAGVHS
jgi:glycosyltransferase involved in cell wall biosynthesis